jgi:hypothetical protein
MADKESKTSVKKTPPPNTGRKEERGKTSTKKTGTTKQGGK